ncbi:MAG: BACON domain-containing protein [Dysgonomonas sp.]
MNKLAKLIVIISIVIFTGCDKDDDSLDPTITIETSHFTLGAKTDLTGYVNFSTTADWTTSAISYEGTEEGWLTITPASGSAGDNQEITLTASVNASEVTDRTAYLTINYGGKTHKLTITQSNFEDKDITAKFDPKFAATLEAKNYIPHANKIMLSDVVDITSINVAGTYDSRGSLSSLAGIEYFTALTHLDCSYNQLATLNITKNTALTDLSCHYNRLTALDVTKNIALTLLNCSHNQLMRLDVTKSTALTVLWCPYNELKSLDVTKNTMLTDLSCSYNQLTNLDVTKNTALINLYCSNNLINTLKTANTALVFLKCSHNELKSLDITKNTALTVLDCFDNQLISLDITKNTELTYLWCYYNQLTALDTSKNTALIYLHCYLNNLIKLDITNNMRLTDLWCFDNPGNGTKFVVTTWASFDTSNILPNFTNRSWLYNGNTISIEYQK